MLGLMNDAPLLIADTLVHAAHAHADQEIVTQTVEGPIHRYTWDHCHRRAQQLARALAGLGLGFGDRVGTIAWNTHRHLETYFATSGSGLVCHTINPRLHPEQVAYIVGHAEDRALLVDLTMLPLVQALAGKLPTVRHVVVMTDRAHMPDTAPDDFLCYEELLDAQPADYDWPRFDERTASSLCYTSGTTGNPKGVLYSHRSTVLHSFAIALPGAFAMGETVSLLPVVPMFHVNAWGVPYAAAITGTRLVMPGPRLDGDSLFKFMDAEGVTKSAGVPTVWLGLLQAMKVAGRAPAKLHQVVIGGSAASRTMIEAFESFGVEVLHAWGMTETSPLGTACMLKPGREGDDKDARYATLVKQGRSVYGVQLKIVDQDGAELPNDGKAQGEVKVRGPWIAAGYYRQPDDPAFDADGWFATADVATIDADGYMQIVDRTKDLIKSGGEWISSIDLENAAVAHPDIAQAAVIGIPDDRWGERPLLIAVPADGAEPTRATVLEHLAANVAKWWLPDDVVFVEQLPLGATGKVQKTKLREQYAKPVA